MRIIFRSIKISELQTGLIYTILGLAGFGLSLMIPNILDYIPPCLFRTITGIPCPACGTSHAGVSLSHLNVKEAFLSNPLFTLFFMGLAAWGANTLTGLFFGKNISFELKQCERRVIYLILLFSMPVNWIFLIIYNL